MVSSTVESALLGETQGELVLRVRGTHRHGQKIHLAKPKCTVGSGPDCSLRLAAPGIQPLHCLILQGERGSVVRRWGPDTRLNGQSFHDAALAVGDRLSVGPLEFDILALPGSLVQETPLEQAAPQAAMEQVQDTTAEVERLTEQQRELRRRMRKLARRRVEQLIGRLREARHEAVELQQTRRSQEATVQSLTSEAAQLREKARTQQQRYEAAERDRQQLVARLQELAGRQSLESPIQAVVAQAAPTHDHELALAESEAKLATTAEQLATTEAQRAHGESKLAEVQQEIENLQSELAARDQELVELRGERDSVEETLNSLRIALEDEQQRSVTSREEWESQRLRIEAELNSARQALAESEQAREEQAATHAEEVSQLNDSLAAVEQGEAASEPQAEEIERLAAEVERLEKLLADAANELQAERFAWSEQQQSWEYDRGQLEEQCRELTETAERLQQVEQEVAGQTESTVLRAELNELSDQLKAKKLELEAEYESHREDRERFERERQAAATSLEEQRNLLGDERLEISAEQNRLAAQQQAQEDRHYELQSRLAELEEREQQLERQRERLASEAESPSAASDESYESEPEPSSYNDSYADSLTGQSEEEDTDSSYEEQTPTSEAPLSTADILARFGHSMEDLDDEQPADTDEAASPSGYQAAYESPSEPVEEPVEEPRAWSVASPADTAGGEEDEESIESYMASLLRRVSGGAEPSHGHASPADEPKYERPKTGKKKAAPAHDTAVEEQQAELKEYVRQTPPEMTSNLAAMRDLANQSARSAIDHSTRRRWGQAALGKFIVAVVAALSGVLLWYWASDASWYAQFGLWTALVIATFWLLQSAVLFKNLLVSNRDKVVALPGLEETPETAEADTTPVHEAVEEEPTT